MPELPEVETIKRQLARKLVGKKWSAKKIVGVRRRAKMLLVDFVDGSSLVFHLKLTGQLIFNGQPGRYTRQVFNFSDGTRLVFNDKRKFGWFKLVSNVDSLKEIKKLGPEPFDVTPADFNKRLLVRRRAKIKSLLMDQTFIAGIGNIYADEILFKAKVRPDRIASSLTKPEVKEIFSSIKKVLTAAIKAGGSSVEDYIDAEGKKGGYRKLHKVYQRTGQECFKCATPIKRLKLGGRSSHFCPHCQI
jgi:formamidopyrimidine-DNA glycosylase